MQNNNIKSIMNGVLKAYGKNRRNGLTTALIDACRNANGVVITANYDQALAVKKQGGVDSLGVASIDLLSGEDKVLLMDSPAINYLLSESILEITNLENIIDEKNRAGDDLIAKLEVSEMKIKILGMKIAELEKKVPGRNDDSRCTTSASQPSTDLEVSDGHGNIWSKMCPQCDKMDVVIARPGKAQCMSCGASL